MSDARYVIRDWFWLSCRELTVNYRKLSGSEYGFWHNMGWKVPGGKDFVTEIWRFGEKTLFLHAKIVVSD